MNKTEAAWATKTADIAGFASPWVVKTHVRAYAYPVALNFADAIKGFKGKRSNVMFKMDNTCEAGKRKCVACGIKLSETGPGATKPDTNSTWTYNAKSKTITGGMHYACSWGATITKIFELADKGILG